MKKPYLFFLIYKTYHVKVAININTWIDFYFIKEGRRREKKGDRKEEAKKETRKIKKCANKAKLEIIISLQMSILRKK